MKRTIAAICASLALAACGGGGGDDAASAPTPSASAEGLWTGIGTASAQVALVILEDGETWGIYTDSGNAITGALYGNTATSGTTLSGSGHEFNITSQTVTPASYSGSFMPKTSISVIGATSSGTYQSAYETAASLSAVVGDFSGQAVTGAIPAQSFSLAVSSSGEITSPALPDCSIGGNVMPRPSGKNIFNVTVTFTGSSCAFPGATTLTGIGYYDAITGQVLVMAMNSAKDDGFIFVGAKTT